MGTRNNPQEDSNQPEEGSRPSKKIPEFILIPVDVRQPRIADPTVPDVTMAEAPVTHYENATERGPLKSNRPSRQSQISAQVGDKQVVTQILNAPVILCVGEVLASSKEVSEQLANLVKRRNPQPAIVGHTLASTKDAGKLIKIPLKIEEMHVMGIIDTGSELNVINQRIIRGLTENPVDPRRNAIMNDANGGAGSLKGHISDVILKCGSVETLANLYIGDSVPFDLLLGWPWQRENLVTIDECIDGTYLVFKDAQDTDATFELLVEDHAPIPDYPFDIHNPPQLGQYTVGMTTHLSLEDSTQVHELDSIFGQDQATVKSEDYLSSDIKEDTRIDSVQSNNQNTQVNYNHDPSVERPESETEVTGLHQETVSHIPKTELASHIEIESQHLDLENLCLPSNGIPPPAPSEYSYGATDNVRLKIRKHFQKTQAGWYKGQEVGQQVIISSPVSMRLGPRETSGHLMEDIAMIGCSFIFLQESPHPPSIRIGDLFATFRPYDQTPVTSDPEDSESSLEEDPEDSIETMPPAMTPIMIEHPEIAIPARTVESGIATPEIPIVTIDNVTIDQLSSPPSATVLVAVAGPLPSYDIFLLTEVEPRCNIRSQHPPARSHRLKTTANAANTSKLTKKIALGPSKNGRKAEQIRNRKRWKEGARKAIIEEGTPYNAQKISTSDT
ncbi:hypothetical protein Hypma_012503 [Hypsizygus marmoreus]|uniref:Uncharacterized protein n=1 Tax=Hypsizygus marmoreus TaxID=39966 RepID=A0A369JIK2_HYPMA|nr:hypothetical protein Hypma_012503 [Hypsizygus marmoreus]